jgi:hypothetical protein
MRADFGGRLSGNDAHAGLRRGQRGNDVQPGLQPSAVVAQLRELGSCPQMRELLGVN